MARLRLDTQLDSESYWYRGGSAPERRMLHGYVPFVSIFFVPPSVPVASWKPPDLPDDLRQRDAVVDTGCPFTILPYECWSPLAGETQLLDQTGIPKGLSGIGGIQASYTLRRVRLALIDEDYNWMPPEWVVARCLDALPPGAPAHNPIPPLLGLTSEFFLKGRRFRHDTKEKLVTELEQQGDSPPATVEAPQWWLEDPPSGLLTRLAGAK